MSFTDFLSTCSIAYWERSVELPTYNCGSIYCFSHVYRFLLHAFWSSVFISCYIVSIFLPFCGLLAHDFRIPSWLIYKFHQDHQHILSCEATKSNNPEAPAFLLSTNYPITVSLHWLNMLSFSDVPENSYLSTHASTSAWLLSDSFSDLLTLQLTLPKLCKVQCYFTKHVVALPLPWLNPEGG